MKIWVMCFGFVILAVQAFYYVVCWKCYVSKKFRDFLLRGVAAAWIVWMALAAWTLI